MTLTELRYIVMLAKEKHFGNAAQCCFVSQPTLSIAVKKLEEELGVAIFERTKGHVQTTPVGEDIVTQAQKILEQAATIKDIAISGKDQLNSPLTVGAIFTVGPYLFPHVVPQLQEIAPEMPLIIEEGYTSTLRAQLRSGELDVVIVSLPFSEPDVVTQALFEEPFVVLLPASHKLGNHKYITAQDLEEENLLLLGEGHCFRDQIFESCPNLRNNFEQRTTQSRTATLGSSIETLRHMVASRLGVTILPFSATLNSYYNENALLIRRFEPPAPVRTVAMAWRVSFPRHKAIDVLRKAIQTCGMPI